MNDPPRRRTSVLSCKCREEKSRRKRKTKSRVKSGGSISSADSVDSVISVGSITSSSSSPTQHSSPRLIRQSTISVSENRTVSSVISVLEPFPGEVSDQISRFISEVLSEFSNENIALVIHTSRSPERYLEECVPRGIVYLQRRVLPERIVNSMVEYMKQYYDLSIDRHPFSPWRQRLDELLWDSMSYVIPLLCRQVIDDVLSHEDQILTIGPNVLIFGDIHGNLNDIYYIFNNFITQARFETHRFVFLGDYVDRGPKGPEVVIFLLALKLIMPKRVFLLRGNHEVCKVNKKYGFKKLIEHIYADAFIHQSKVGLLPKLIYQSFNQVFNHMPLGAVIRWESGTSGVFCCHGGIPSESLHPECRPWTIGELNALKHHYKPHHMVPAADAPAEQKALNELLWNDPVANSVTNKIGLQKLFYKNKKRGGHCSWFTEKAARRFLEANKLRLLVRGHQYQCTKDTGFAYNFGPSSPVLTVFSSSNYCGTEVNTTGYVDVTEHEVCPRVLRETNESKAYHYFNEFDVVYDSRTKEVVKVIF